MAKRVTLLSEDDRPRFRFLLILRFIKAVKQRRRLRGRGQRQRKSVANEPGHGSPSVACDIPLRRGWLFIALGFLLFLLGIAMALCISIAGRCLSRRKCYTFALVIACLECLFIPFGTILGVFTIVALSRESVKALFATAQPPC